LPSNNGCYCPTGQYLINQACVTCDPNSSYNSSLSTCICNSGYFGTYLACYQCNPSCKTCTGASNNQCLSCANNNNQLVNGVCQTGCPAGQYINANNQCSQCSANCIDCSGSNSCSTCANGFSLSLTLSEGTIVVTCTILVPPASGLSKLSLRGSSVGNGVLYQGVGISQLPTTIISSGCSICDSLLQVIVTPSIPNLTINI